jgi:hypothetical protein
MKGCEPHEPTNTFSFYKRKPVLKENLIFALPNSHLGIFFNKIFFLKRKVLWCIICALKILGRRIWCGIFGKYRST